MIDENDSPFPPGSTLVGYIRDSGGDNQELSAKQQEHYMGAWCKDHGYILARLFIDASSGTTTTGRDQFQAMIEHFHSDPPEAGLLIWRHNRFARNVDDAQYYKSGLRRRGFIVHSLMDKIPQGTFSYVIETMEDTFSQKKSEQLSEDVRRGLHDNLADFGTLGGTPPRGFIRQTMQISTHRDGKPHLAARWVPDPEILPIIKKVWQMRSAGTSYGTIKAETHLFRSINSFCTFFRNKLYIGILEFGDTVIDNYCDPIIDMETWNAVQAINAKNKFPPTSANHPRRISSSFLLSGLAYCGVCESPLNGYVINSKDGKIYNYYRCSRKCRNRDCTAKVIPKETLEEHILAEIANHITTPENIAHIRAVDAAEADQAAQRSTEQITALTAQSGTLQRKINNLIDAIADQGHSSAMLQRLNDLEQEFGAIKAQIQEIDQSASLPPPQQLPPGDLSVRFNAALQNATLEQKRTILHGFIDRITVKRTDKRQISGTIYYYQPQQKDSPDDEDAGESGFYAYVSHPRGGTNEELPRGSFFIWGRTGNPSPKI
ncbi:MAG: recombinase family protein [Chloroflexota bacterium]